MELSAVARRTLTVFRLSTFAVTCKTRRMRIFDRRAPMTTTLTTRVTASVMLTIKIIRSVGVRSRVLEKTHYIASIKARSRPK